MFVSAFGSIIFVAGCGRERDLLSMSRCPVIKSICVTPLTAAYGSAASVSLPNLICIHDCDRALIAILSDVLKQRLSTSDFSHPIWNFMP